MYGRLQGVVINMEWKCSVGEITVWNELYRIAIPCAVGYAQSLRIWIWLSWACTREGRSSKGGMSYNVRSASESMGACEFHDREGT